MKVTRAEASGSWAASSRFVRNAVSGEHENRLAQARRAYLATKVKAGTVGQAHVEDDEMWVMLARALNAFDAGSCPCDGVAFPL